MTQGTGTYPPAPVVHSEWVCGTLCHRSPLPWSCLCWWVGYICGWHGLGDLPAPVVLPPSCVLYSLASKSIKCIGYPMSIIVATISWEIQKSHFQRYYSHIGLLLIICVISEDNQTVIHLPTPPENVTTLNCKLQNFFIWLKVCCVFSSIGGSEKNQLWCMATGMSGKQCHSKCSEWPRSALVHSSGLYRHWSVA